MTVTTFRAVQDNLVAAEAYQYVASVWGFDTWIKSLKPAPADLEIFVKLKCTKQPLSCGCQTDQ